MTVLLLFGTFILFLIIGVPIAMALGISALVSIYFGTNLPLGIITQKAFTALDSFPLLAIPFFMLAGILMGKGGVSKRLLNLATKLVGWMTGGLSLVTVVACMFFAAISGSGPATVAAIGGFMIPAMIARKYESGFAAAVTAAAGSIGVIIPPSIPLVLYGVIGSVSVGSMFLAGVIPGIMIGFGLMITSFIIAKRKGFQSDTMESFDFSEVLDSAWDAKWALLIPVIILGGIYGGIFSPTEAAVVAVVYALLIGLFVYKELTWQDVYDSFLEAVTINATTMIIIGLSVSVAYYMTLEQMPNDIASFLTSISTNPFVILLVINILLFIVGMFIDTISALVVLTPILLPIVTNVGVDPIHFGIILVANLALGFVTPPLGVNLFVASSVGNVRFERIVTAIIPFILSMLICLLLITYLPGLSLWLPEFLKK
ncbi:TRAP transporter large permease [Lysinibacillus capsici]|uniref:TRAP transporter large permease n=1 Tax=Lysinibacillus capsici TaxID=2115968 RepID=UPI0034E5D413